MRVQVTVMYSILTMLIGIHHITGQVKKTLLNNTDGNHSELIDRETNAALKDSVYHAGALLFMDLNLDINKLKSTFCLSCHDGSVTSDGHTSSNIGNPESVSKMGVVQNFDHPVAFKYTEELAKSNRNLKDPNSFSVNLKGTIADVLLVDGSIECVTCHNIFFKTEKKQRYNILNEGVGTLLCFECHSIK